MPYNLHNDCLQEFQIANESNAKLRSKKCYKDLAAEALILLINFYSSPCLFSELLMERIY